MSVQTSGAVIVSAVTTIGFVAVCAAMLFVPVQDSAVANVMFGALGSGFTLVLGYWLGSSSGSRAKDKQIAELTTVAASAQPQ